MGKNHLKCSVIVMLCLAIGTFSAFSSGCSKLDGAATAAAAATPEETAAVASDKDALTTSSLTIGSGDTVDAITQDFTLPLMGAGGSTLSWASSDATVIAISGASASVTRPSVDTAVTLTATITNGGASDTKAIVITVVAATAAAPVATADPVYYAGYSRNSSSVMVPGYWNAGAWTALSVLDSAKSGYATNSFVAGSDFYLCGYSINSSNLMVPGYWKNGTWSALTNPNGLGATATAIFVSGANVYASGRYYTGSVWIPGYWVNNTWTDATVTSTAYSSYTSGIGLVGNDLYVAGYRTSGTLGQDVGYWLNNTWTSLSVPDTNQQRWSTGMTIVGSDVYVTGYFNNGTGYAAVWKNGTRTTQTSLTSYQAMASNVTVSGSDVYVIGSSNNASNNSAPGYWLNATFHELTALDSTKSSQTNGLVISNSDIYVGGISTNSSNLRVPGYWKNGTWAALPVLDATMNSEVITVFKR